MKTKAIILATLLLGCQVLPAQNYYMQYTHDTLGNRTNRVRGILTREMEAVGMSSDTVLQDIIITDNAIPAFTDIDNDGQDSDKCGLLVKTRAEKEAFFREMTAMTARLNPIKTEKEAARITLGSYINMNNHDEKTLRHEYGHTKQSQYLGPLYLKIVGLPSLVGCVVDVNHEHRNEWYEVWANNISYNYHDEYDLKDKYGSFVRDSWDRTIYPLDFKPDWYFYATIACYPMFLLNNNPFNLINVFF